jgi:hypothetical protein
MAGGVDEAPPEAAFGVSRVAGKGEDGRPTSSAWPPREPNRASSGGMLFAKTNLVPVSVAPPELLRGHHYPLHCLQGLFVLPTSELGQRGKIDW